MERWHLEQSLLGSDVGERKSRVGFNDPIKRHALRMPFHFLEWYLHEISFTPHCLARKLLGALLDSEHTGSSSQFPLLHRESFVYAKARAVMCLSPTADMRLGICGSNIKISRPIGLELCFHFIYLWCAAVSATLMVSFCIYI